MYSNMYRKENSNTPLIIAAVVFTVVAVAIGVYLFVQYGSLPRFSIVPSFTEKKLKRIEVVNVTPQQIGIFWQSEEKETGWIVYGDSPDNLSNRILDEYDTDAEKKKRLFHYTLLKGLEPDTAYYVKIVSGRQTIADTDGKPFTLYTPPSDIYTSTSADPAYGKVTFENGNAAPQVYVLLHYKNSYPLLSRTKENGEWLIPLQISIDMEKNTGVPYGSRQDVRLEMLSEQGSSEVMTKVEKLSPVTKPTALGKNYTFLAQRSGRSTGSVLDASTRRDGDQEVDEVALLFPRESAVIPGTKPLIKGKGIPGMVVNVHIQADPEYTFRARVDEDGSWIVRVPSAMKPGTYLLTMQTVDEDGEEVLIKRYFVIAKSGQTVLGEATGSGELSPSKKPTPKPTSNKDDEEDPAKEPTKKPSEEEIKDPTKKPTVRATKTPRPTVKRATSTPRATATKRPSPTERTIVRRSSPTPSTYGTGGAQQVVTPTPVNPEPPVAGFIGGPLFLGLVGFFVVGSILVFVV